MFDIHKVREDFPILSTTVYGKPLVYFDNAATTQIPKPVLDSLVNHYETSNANVHRGIHSLSEKSTAAMNRAREIIARFINSPSPDQILFTSGATESLNLVGFGYLKSKLSRGDRVITTEFEHHSNYVIWQQLCLEAEAEFVVVPEKDGGLDMDFLFDKLNSRTRLLSMTAVSNVTGARLAISEAITAAHKYGVPVCIDNAQGVRHGTNAANLDCDFLCFSGHKMMGPAGTGVLYAKDEMLKEMIPVKYGGGMVDKVFQKYTTFAENPFCFEAGTPNYPGIIALAAVVDYLEGLDMASIAAYEDELMLRLEAAISEVEGVVVVAKDIKKTGALSIAIDGIHPYDVASLLDKFGIAVRSGNHCAQPLLRKLGYESLIRFSPAFYNTFTEIDYIQESLFRVVEMLSKWK